MHSARLLITVFYLTPIAAILWHTLSERLLKYHQVNLLDLNDFHKTESSSKLVLQQKVWEFSIKTLANLQHTVLILDSQLKSEWLNIKAMSTRYWDEIDWYIQEGTQKLCEMLNSENENEDASSSKWSTGEEDDETKGTKQKTEEETQNENENIDAEDTAKKLSDLSVKDEASDGDSVKDDEDYMERSTSVEDENPTILKKQTKIDDLVSLCTKCGMMPPIYTYFTTGDEQVVSTVQLWNGVRFSSHPQVTRDKAMEEAAGHALNYLNAELRENRPVSTSPPSTLPYYVPVQNLVQPQYYAHQAAYAQPLPYAAASAQSYFVPSVPYTVLPPAPVVTIASDYQQAAIMHPQYSLGHQYAPYIHQYPPYVQLQVSPTRQPKGAQYHGSSAKPVVWNSPYLKDSYLVQDKASVPQTEFRLLDRPPTESSPTMEQKQNFQVKEAESNVEGSEQKSVNTANVQKKQQAPKPKLAISFNKDKNED